MILELSNSRCPFDDWINSLDKTTNARIKRRIGRLRLGNFGVTKKIGQNISELILDFGPGYRVYFSKHQNKLVVLLGGGSKRTQKADIRKAKKLWKEYKNETQKFQKKFT